LGRQNAGAVEPNFFDVAIPFFFIGGTIMSRSVCPGDIIRVGIHQVVVSFVYDETRVQGVFLGPDGHAVAEDLVFIDGRWDWADLGVGRVRADLFEHLRSFVDVLRKVEGSHRFKRR
jgi:hypothetical protein